MSEFLVLLLTCQCGLSLLDMQLSTAGPAVQFYMQMCMFLLIFCIVAAAFVAAISSYRLVGIPVGGGANITVSGAGQPGSGNQVRSTGCVACVRLT